jgi:hypothetical protein
VIMPPQLPLPPNVSTMYKTAQADSKLPNLHKKRQSDLDPYSGREHSGKKARKDASQAPASHSMYVYLLYFLSRTDPDIVNSV